MFSTAARQSFVACPFIGLTHHLFHHSINDYLADIGALLGVLIRNAGLHVRLRYVPLGQLHEAGWKGLLPFDS